MCLASIIILFFSFFFLFWFTHAKNSVRTVQKKILFSFLQRNEKVQRATNTTTFRQKDKKKKMSAHQISPKELHDLIKDVYGGEVGSKEFVEDLKAQRDVIDAQKKMKEFAGKDGINVSYNRKDNIFELFVQALDRTGGAEVLKFKRSEVKGKKLVDVLKDAYTSLKGEYKKDG